MRTTEYTRLENVTGSGGQNNVLLNSVDGMVEENESDCDNNEI